MKRLKYESTMARAAELAKADPELRLLLEQPGVMEALERIAADPHAVMEFQGSEMVMTALDKMHGLLQA